MDREIKFRAWVDAYGEKEMINDYCYLDKKENHFFGVDLVNERPDISKVLDVMQFTGLKDKNGKEIYEGDILKGHDGFIYRVWNIDGGFVINTHVWAFKNDIKMTNPFPFDCLAEAQLSQYIQQQCEVIGNIYENPEILK